MSLGISTNPLNLENSYEFVANFSQIDRELIRITDKSQLLAQQVAKVGVFGTRLWPAFIGSGCPITISLALCCATERVMHTYKLGQDIDKIVGDLIRLPLEPAIRVTLWGTCKRSSRPCVWKAFWGAPNHDHRS